jgi:penicillin-insensitive murein endopeptidase
VRRLATIGLMLLPLSAWSTTPQSTCYGTTANGRLEHGFKLPAEGKNFVSYSGLAGVLGRTYLHSTARGIVLDAYRTLETNLPEKVFKYAETGFEEGGPFKPHKTHQNGLSIDFMVPVLDRNGNSVHLPTYPFNKFGYNIEFNDKGEYADYRIDFEAMAAHIVALHEAAKKHQARVWRVIFDPNLQPQLMQTSHSADLKQFVTFSKKRSWVRHDDHYHVDFTIPCKPL